MIFLISSLSLAESSEIAYENQLLYENNLLKEENQRLRNELLSLRLKIDDQVAENIPVLLYHHLASKEDIESFGWEKNGSIIPLDNFKEQMDYLYENNFYTATLEELELFIDGKIDLPKNTVVITFDDGYLSNVDYAYPIMKEYGFRGSIFMVGETATRDESNLMPGELYHIPALEVYKYRDVFEFGCHTFSMHGKDEEGVSLLISNSKEEIVEDLMNNQELFGTKYMAYPYGDYNLNTIDFIEELGYTMAFTVKPGYVSRASDKFELDRLPVLPSTSIEKFVNLVNLK